MNMKKITLQVWRQADPKSKGKMTKYTLSEADGLNEHMSFLELLDVLNEKLTQNGADPIAFDHDCREGICGSCGVMINGKAHGGFKGTTTCQVHMRLFKDGDEIYVEPFRAAAFPVVKDLIVDRSAFDKIIQSGGFVSINTGNAPEANAVPVGKETADLAMDAAQCIGCGACVASCKNASAMLFVSAKVSHLGLLPQGEVENAHRVQTMVKTMDEAGFGNCTNQYECEATCPKEISVNFIGKMNREYLKATIASPVGASKKGSGGFG